MMKTLLKIITTLFAICFLSSVYNHLLNTVALYYNLGSTYDSSMRYHRFIDTFGESAFFLGVPFVFLEIINFKKLTNHYLIFLVTSLLFNFIFFYGSGSGFNFENVFTLIFLSSFFVAAAVYSFLKKKIYRS